MQTYTIDTPDGSSYKVEAENDQQAQSAIQSYLPSTPSESSFDPQKAIQNIGPDLKQIGSGLATPFPKKIMDLAKLGGLKLATGESPASIGMDALKSVAAPALHPLQYAEEHPVQQALNILGVGQLATRGVGAALDAVPLTENVLPSLERVANNQTLKGFGGTMGQLKQMAQGSGGMAALDEAAQYAREKGLADVFTTEIGRKKLLDNLLEQSGQTIGNLRQEAGPAPVDMINKLLSNPKANMNEYLGEGLASGQLPMADKAISDIQRIAGQNPTHANLAEAATYINKQAAGNKLYQPVTAATDVANALSDENNQGIAQALGSEKAKQYVEALGEQQKLHPLEHLEQRGELRMAGGRGGIGLQMVQKLADEFGYRLSAKTAAAIHDSLVSDGIPITKAAIAAKLTNLSSTPSIGDLINQLKRKYDKRRNF